MRTEKRKIGDVGEGIACKFLMKHGYEIVERNYLRKWGEIDIVSKRSGKLIFVEVKTIVGDLSVIRETLDNWRAEDNIHIGKLKRLSRIIQTYLLERGYEGEWQFDVVTVTLDQTKIRTKVQHLKDIVL
ncbi:MAG: hypothetical protein A2741_01115 [Candidatus Zambryskibacteria bacterium RIFCSPHIGHO2_01_FULL_43_27]|uniref:UPF0102 protein A2920_01695 n=1 Tax=Candidatus Zambryskibacteria bacterium RIFCSPLOWO2_01_FULL_43_17 TaxID=1802760 RepID=A0A1G2U6I5_9BACT|nr:MAG: hypothetical protein A2741_01115 [Candidatus Zambryskibacteria bacterium RIFCSPHIGHO2_01_FULL_43_27]OHB00099.1 MAG: hypothetical protein A3E93_02110 [Candidatus Zambryskibacteria bacterium RIFCSPHIGHO2_12_FULL_43_12b]OHB04630.1 MAG: hypothetical protein A2920_01695 [Candidatus Zambryskibacteria bacterium RIFCSPLOWO2_01_FULL_43_17]